jgi:hypothetical protein
MRSTIVIGLSLALLAATAIGCRQDRAGEPRMSQRELQNISRLEPYPEPVRAAFLREFPLATITRVDVYNDVTGRVVYEVNFVQDNQVRSAIYTSEGMRITPPAERPGEMQPTAPPPVVPPPGTPPAADPRRLPPPAPPPPPPPPPSPPPVPETPPPPPM